MISRIRPHRGARIAGGPSEPYLPPVPLTMSPDGWDEWLHRMARTINSLIGRASGAAPIAGVTDGSNAAAGQVGEYLTTNLLGGSPLAMVSTVARDILTLALTAGDWDVWADISITPAGGSPTGTHAWIGTVSATAPTSGASTADLWWQLMPAGTAALSWPVGRQRFNLSAPGNAYLSIVSTFPGTSSAYGMIAARRMR